MRAQHRRRTGDSSCDRRERIFKGDIISARLRERGTGLVYVLTVFRRDGKTIRHCWGSEILYAPPEPGQEYRHNDALDPLWNMLDVTPEGRGDFHPQLNYGQLQP